MSVNYVVDPMWCFNHETSFAKWREFIDERKQKANLLRYRNVKIDTIVIGTSRSLCLNPCDFGNNGMNLALIGCMAFEYPYIISLFYKTHSYYPSHIVLGIDFFSSASYYTDGKLNNKMKEIVDSLPSNTIIDKIETIANINLFKKSINLIIDNLNGNMPKNASIIYTKGSMISTAIYLPIDNLKAKTKTVKNNYNYYKSIYRNYLYNENYTKNIQSIAQLRPSTHVSVFISPVGTPFLRLLVEIPHMMDNYERMLRETVNVFGGIWNFMYVNSATSDHIYWREPSHHLSKIDEWITARITGTGDCPKDFGIYMTQENIDYYIQKIKHDIYALKYKEDSWTPLLK